MVNSATDKSPKVFLNGRSVSIGHNVHATLLDFLRDPGLTGAKEGCAEGECGACTLVMLEDYAGGCAYRAVNRCLMLAPMAADREIYTVEALAFWNAPPSRTWFSGAMLAISVRHMIPDAVAAFGKGGDARLAVPATPERVFFAVRRAHKESAAEHGVPHP